MIFRLITDLMPGNTILETCNCMMNKFGTDKYADMIREGFEIPFSKYRREFWKAYVKGKFAAKRDRHL